jgi:PAS domain S-box-containing protein
MKMLQLRRQEGIKMPIRHKIAIYMAALICVTVGINTYTTVRTETKVLTNKIIYGNKRLVRNIAFRIKKAFLVSNQASVEDILADPTIGENTNMIYIKVIEPGGKVYMASESSFVGETVDSALLVEQEDVVIDHFFPRKKRHGILIIHPAVIDGERWHIIAGFPSVQIRTTIKYLILQNLMSGSFVILLGAFVSFFFAKTICDPILSLTKAAKIIADGDLTHRVTANTKDEVGELARTFNDMAVKLKKSHTNLEEKVEELAAEKELLSITLSGMSEGLIAVDIDKRIILFNTVAEELCGREFKEVEGKLVDDIFQLVNEQTKEPLESPITRALQSGETECGSENDVLLSKDSSECPVYTSAAPIREDKGGIIGVVMVFRDVSYEREIDRMKTDFVSSVSHELRTPLTSIKAYTDTILRDSSMPEETKSQFLVVISEETNRLAALIEDLLEVSRIASGTVKIERVFINIEAVIEKVLTAVKPLAEKKNIRLETKIPDGLPKLQADESKIESVVINLVNNAIKFTPEKGRVSIYIETANNEMLIRVSDTGMGMPKEALPKIFDRFYRVHRPGKQIQGTGLGLSIVKKIVTVHDGRIEVESETDKGTSFTVFLPLVSQNEQETTDVLVSTSENGRKS